MKFQRIKPLVSGLLSDSGCRLSSAKSDSGGGVYTAAYGNSSIESALSGSAPSDKAEGGCDDMRSDEKY